MYVKIQLDYAEAHDLIFGIENPIAKSKRQNGSHPLLGKTHFSLPIEIIIHVCMYCTVCEQSNFTRMTILSALINIFISPAPHWLGLRGEDEGDT